jgi:aminoglycoside phosphotransferase (APT) family kinase protein
MSDTFLQQLQTTYKTTKQDLIAIINAVMNDDITEELPIKPGYSNEVHLLRTSKGQELIVRIDQHNVTGFEQEAWAMAKAKSLSVSVAHVYDIRSFEIAGESKNVMLMQKVDGQPLSEMAGFGPAEFQYVCKQLGAALSKLHSQTVEGFGWPKANRQWEFATWQDYIAATLQQRERDMPYLVQAGLTQTETEQMLAVVKEMKPFEPVLCHGDLSLEHIFVDDKLNLTAFIDWGLCQAGSRALDVAMLLMYHPEIELSWLLQGYRDLEVSEKSFRREMLIQQANVAMSFVGHNMREGNEDAREIALQGMRLLLENWRSV